MGAAEGGATGILHIRCYPKCRGATKENGGDSRAALSKMERSDILDNVSEYAKSRPLFSAQTFIL